MTQPIHHPQPPRSFRRVAVLATIAGLILALPVSALDLNGFMPAPGTGNLALSYTAESYDEFWAGTQKTSAPPLGEVSTYSTSAWFQWGLGRDLSLVGDIAFVDTSGDGFAGFEENGVQDLVALVQYRFASLERERARHDFLVAGGLRTPIGDYEADLPVALGDGTTDGLFRFIYHFERGPFYFSQQVGFSARGGDAPDGFPLYTELGLTHRRITYTGFYSLYRADGGTDIGDPGFTFPSNGDEFERVGAKIYGRLRPDLGISVFAFTTLDGRNCGDATGISFGASYAF